MVSYFTPLPLREEFAKGVHCQYCYTLFQLRYLPISLKRAKGIQIEDHRIKIVDSADDAAIFLGDITCLNRIQVFEDASRSKINFSKAKHYGLEHIRIELINQDKVNGQNVPLKDLE